MVVCQHCKTEAPAFLQNILNYYFQKTYIAPQDVSQQLFGFNLTSTTATLNDSSIQSLVSELGTTQGQLLVATASANDQAAINALQPRMNSLSGNLTKLNNDILVRPAPDNRSSKEGPVNLFANPGLRYKPLVTSIDAVIV